MAHQTVGANAATYTAYAAHQARIDNEERASALTSHAQRCGAAARTITAVAAVQFDLIQGRSIPSCYSAQWNPDAPDPCRKSWVRT